MEQLPDKIYFDGTTDKNVFYEYEDNKILYETIKRHDRVYEVDRECDKVILVSHNGGDGANFLINCLTFSSSVNFRNFTLKEKLLFFRNKLKQESGKDWKDLFVMHIQVNQNPDVLINSGNSVIIQKTHFHIKNELQQSLEFWKNSKNVILLENIDLFTKLRYGYCSNGIDEKFESTLLGQYKKLEDYEKNIIKNTLYAEDEDEDGVEVIDGHDIKGLSENYPDKAFHIWNVEWFLSKQDTLENIKNFYDILGLDGYNEKVISIAYEMWMTKLDEIKNNITTYWSTGIG